MNADSVIFSRAAELSAAGEPFMLLTVIESVGSAPRAAGARMIVRAGQDGAEQIGTIGGGGMEHQAIREAIDLHTRGESALRRYGLTPDEGRACGGSMQVFLEYIGSALRLVIFGAGHVAAELARVIRDADLAVTIVDERPQWNTAERFPGARLLLSNDEGIALAQEEPQRTLVCVMTYSHDIDFEICCKLLAQPPAYLGMMGSMRKKALTFTRLVEAGCARDAVESIRSPIGIGDLGKAPSLLAVSIAAEVLTEAKRLVKA